MNPITRRSFLKTSALAAAGTALSARSWGQVTGANGDIRVAVVGLNNRGRDLSASFRGMAGVRVVDLDALSRDERSVGEQHQTRVKDHADAAH